MAIKFTLACRRLIDTPSSDLIATVTVLETGAARLLIIFVDTFEEPPAWITQYRIPQGSRITGSADCAVPD